MTPYHSIINNIRLESDRTATNNSNSEYAWRKEEMKDNIWSPKNREAYTVKVPTGEKKGLGARGLFVDHPGLWNMFWLHSVRVDTLLDWEGDPEEAPEYSIVLNLCMESMFIVCKGTYTLEWLAENLTAQQFIQTVLDYDCDFPLRKYMDEPKDDSWLDLVSDRVVNARGYRKQEGNVVTVNF